MTGTLGMAVGTIGFAVGLVALAALGYFFAWAAAHWHDPR